MRDATEAEIAQEPTAVLEALVDGDCAATWVTRELAKNERDRRGIPQAAKV